MTTAPVSQNDIAAFRRDGAVPLYGMFTDWVEKLRQGIEKNLAAPSADARVYDSKGAGGRFFGDYCNWARIPEFEDFIFHSPAASIAAALMGASEVRLFHEHVLIKEPGSDVATPWHQDAPYYCVRAAKSCSLWIPLAVSSALLLIFCTAIWNVLDEYELVPTGIPDSRYQIFVLMLWFFPVSACLLGMVWYSRSRSRSEEDAR